jgi:hypothetical protein
MITLNRKLGSPNRDRCDSDRAQVVARTGAAPDFSNYYLARIFLTGYIGIRGLIRYVTESS